MRTLTKIIMMSAAILVLNGCKTSQARADDQSVNELENHQSKAETAKINVQLGMAYLQQNNVQRAKQKLLLALQQGPDVPEAWYSMAYFLEATGNKEEAGQYYLKSVEIAPKRGDVQNNYGTFLCRSGRYQESMKHFMLAVKAPDYLDPAAAYENAGLCSMKSAAYKQAADYFHQALLKDPARSDSLLNLAEVDIKLKNYKEAREMLTQFTLVSEPTPEFRCIREQLAKTTG